MADTPSDAAKRKACELANARMETNVTKYKVTEVEAYEPLYALALHLDEVDRVAREVDELIEDGETRSAMKRLRSLTLPDPDEELAQEVVGELLSIVNREVLPAEAALATIKRLRADGRLTDG